VFRLDKIATASETAVSKVLREGKELVAIAGRLRLPITTTIPAVRNMTRGHVICVEYHV